MNAIWKFPFEILDDFYLYLPIGAQFLHVEVQQGTPCLWAIVDPSAATEPRKFHVSGTGHPLDEQYTKDKHVGSFLMEGGALVFHLFCE